jgi:ATP-dependent Clp protease adaptor protein ClpS
MNTIFFEKDHSIDLVSKELVDTKINELFKTEPAGKFGLVLHNDPINGVDFVTRVIKSVFGYPTRKAIWLMLKAHFSGSSLLWTGPKEEALSKLNKIISYGPDPAMLHKGSEPLKVSLELQT